MLTFRQYTEDVDTWTLKQAQAVVERITPHFTKHGYSIQIIGSVAKKGFSYSDLDLLIKRKRKNATMLRDVFDIFDKKPFSGWEEGTGTIVLYGNREIDLYYPGIFLYGDEEENEQAEAEKDHQEWLKSKAGKETAKFIAQMNKKYNPKNYFKELKRK